MIFLNLNKQAVYSEENKARRTLFEAWKMTGSVTYKQ